MALQRLAGKIWRGFRPVSLSAVDKSLKIVISWQTTKTPLNFDPLL